MIRIACHVQDYYFEIIKKYFAAKDYYLEKFNPASYDDIYFIEINSLNDLDKIHQINKYPETLIYIIGPKDFHLLNECLTLGVHLYFGGWFIPVFTLNQKLFINKYLLDLKHIIIKINKCLLN